MPGRVREEPTRRTSEYVTSKRQQKAENPNFFSDGNLDTGRDSVTSESSTTSYTSTSTQTSDASTNTIDSNLRVIRRSGNQTRYRVVNNGSVRGRAFYRVVPREDGFTKYVTRRDLVDVVNTRNKENERVILRKRPSSAEATRRVLVRKPSASPYGVIRERPSSDRRVIERRVLRRPLSANENVIRRQVIRKVEQPVRANTLVERRIVRRSENPEVVRKRIIQNPEIVTRRIIEKPVTGTEERRVVRRVISREPSESSRRYIIPDDDIVTRESIRRPRPSSYDGRLVESRPQYVERRQRPSSYHNGMEREYIAIKQYSDDEESETTGRSTPKQEIRQEVKVPDNEPTYQEKVLQEYQTHSEPLERPREPQEQPREPQERPREPQERPRESQERPRTIQQYNINKGEQTRELKDFGNQKWVDEYDVPDTRDVGVQMTTHYKVPEKPKVKTRNVGVQARFKEKKKTVIKEIPVPKEPTPPPTPPPPKYIFVKVSNLTLNSTSNLNEPPICK